MTERGDAERPCGQDGCTGIRLAPARACLAHASDEETAAALKQIGETGEIDARGVPITPALLERILAAAPRGENDEPLIKSCRFDGATFHGHALFGEAKFTGAAGFKGATFGGAAGFKWATFGGRADFDEATFTGAALFIGATFGGSAEFSGATFHGDADFGVATFTRGAGFGRATFGGRAVFGGAKFTGTAGYTGATFDGGAWFGGATFTGRAWFGRAKFTGAAEFGGAIFGADVLFGGAIFKHDAGFAFVRVEQARQFGPMLAYRGLILDDAQFAQPVQIEISSARVCCRRARFLGGVQFRLRWARVVLDDTGLAAPSILAGIPHLSSEELAQQEEQIAREWHQELAGEIPGRPQLVSLRRADVAGLGLSNVSAADCRFAGAHNLDKLRLESDVNFAESRGPLVWGGGWTWGGRQVIAEERTWRARPTRFGHRLWKAPPWPDWLGGDQPGLLDPGQIAGLYRALRKGREDAKDEPGAADFYYGEMEMRRLARRPVHTAGGTRVGEASRGRVERWILTAYWLVSGYGLRAWRAVACLAVIIALLAIAFHRVGFAVPPRPLSYWTSLLYAFRSTLSLTDNQVTLTAWGQLLQAVLRLTGPVLLGLALLALRGRVKR